MPIIQQGSINTTSLIVPDLYVQIVPPQNLGTERRSNQCLRSRGHGILGSSQ